MIKKLQVNQFVIAVAVLGALVVAGIAAEAAKAYRLVVDRPLQVAARTLEPGKYEVKIAVGENQKAQVTFQQKNQTFVQVEAIVEPQQKANEEDGLRAVLPDGKTRVVQKMWFRGEKYLLNMEKATGGTAAAAQVRP